MVGLDSSQPQYASLHSQLALSAWAFAGLSGNQLASFVVSHTTDAVHRYSALIPIITVLYAVALVSIIAVTLATKGKSANALSSR